MYNRFATTNQNRNSKVRSSKYSETPQRLRSHPVHSNTLNNYQQKKVYIGTFEKEYITYDKSDHNGKTFKMQNIIFMTEYQNSSLINKRFEDYYLMINKKCPSDEIFKKMFNVGLRFNHLGLLKNIYPEFLNLNINSIQNKNFNNQNNSETMNRSGTFFNNNNNNRNENNSSRFIKTEQVESQRSSFFNSKPYQVGETNRDSFFRLSNTQNTSYDQNRLTPRFNNFNNKPNDNNNNNIKSTGFFGSQNKSNTDLPHRTGFDNNTKTNFISNRFEQGNENISRSSFFANNSNTSDSNNRNSFMNRTNQYNTNITNNSSFFSKNNNMNNSFINNNSTNGNPSNISNNNTKINSFFSTNNTNNYSNKYNDNNDSNINTNIQRSFINNNNNNNLNNNNMKNSLFPNRDSNTIPTNNLSMQNRISQRNPSPSYVQIQNPAPSFHNQQNQNPSPSFFNQQNPSPSLVNQQNPSPSFFNQQNQNPSPSFFNQQNQNSSPSFFNHQNPSPLYINQNKENCFFDNNQTSNNFVISPENPINYGMPIGYNSQLLGQLNIFPQLYLQPNQNLYYQQNYQFPNTNINKDYNFNSLNKEGKINNELKLLDEKTVDDQLQELEREFLFTQKYIQEIKMKEEDDKFLGYNPVRNKINFFKKNSFIPEKTPQDNLSMMSKNIKKFQINKSTNDSIKLDQNQNLINLDIKIKYLNQEIKIEKFELNKLHAIKNFKSFIIKKMPKFGYDENQINKNSNLLFDMTILKSRTRLKDIEDIEIKNIVLKVDLEIQKEGPKEERILEQDQSFCEDYLFPVLSKVGYKIKPSLIELSRMNKGELENVKDLKIWNDHGEIQWLSPCDLTEQNLDEIVIIKPFEVDVYPDDLYLKAKIKPEQGTKLNRTCIITLFDIKPKTNETMNIFIRKLEKICDQQEATFISYDEMTSFWRFQVEHFTKYKFFDVDLDEEGFSEEEEERDVDSFGDSKVFKEDKLEEYSRGKVIEESQREDSRKSFVEEERELRKDTQKKEENLIDLINKSQNLSFFKSSKISLNSGAKFSLSKKIDRKPDFERESFPIPKENLPVVEIKDNEIIEDKIQKLKESYAKYQKIESEITTNKKKLKFNQMDKKVLQTFSFLNKIINNDKITENSKFFYKTFDFPSQWVDNETISILKKDNFNNTLHETKIKFVQEDKSVNEDYYSIINKLFIEFVNYQISTQNKESISDNLLLLDIFFVNILNEFSNKDFIEPYLFILLISALFSNKCVSFLKSKKFGSDIEDQKNNLSKKIENNQKNAKSEEFLNYHKKRELHLWLEKAIFLIVEIEKLSTYKGSNLFDLFLSNLNEEDIDENSIENLNFKSKKFRNLQQNNLLRNFNVLLKNDKSNSTLETLFTKFKQNNQKTKLDPYENFLLDALEINSYIESKGYLKKEKQIESFIIGSKIIKDKKDLHFFNLLFHSLLMLNTPEIKQNPVFQRNYKWNFKITHEILIQSKCYFSGLMICRHFIAPSLLDKEGYEKHSLNMMLSFSDLNEILFNQIFTFFYPKNELYAYKAFYNLNREDYDRAIKNFCEIGKIEKAYEIFFNNRVVNFILNKKLDYTELERLLNFYDLYRFETVCNNLRDSVILNFLNFVSKDKKHCLFDDKGEFENLVEEILKKIVFCYKNEEILWRDSRDIFVIISSEVFKIISKKNVSEISNDVLDYLKNQFMNKVNRKEILAIFKEEDKNDIIEGFLFLL